MACSVVPERIAGREDGSPYPSLVTDDPDLAGWTFEVEETSAGVYLVRGTDRAGRTVQRHGTDEDALLAKCREWAIDLTRRSSG